MIVDNDAPLRGRVTSGLRWTIVETWGQQALNLVIFVILARLLLPVDFGLVALAAVFVAFAQLLLDQGLGDALIQRREISRRHVDTAFWAAVATGAALTAVGLLLAVPLASLLGEPLLDPILKVLSLTFVLSAFSSIQTALLRRDLAFRTLAMRALVATLGGGAAGIAMAAMGFGAWALVGQQLVAAAVSVLLLWRVSPWRPGRQASRHEFMSLFRFGINVVGSDFLGFLSRNLDNLLIGVYLGTGPLGIYAVGYRILGVSQTLLLNVARKITFPALSRLQDDRQRMVGAYFRVTRTAAMVILPGYVALAIVSPELTTVLFGTRWSEAGVVAATLFLIGPVLSVQAFSNSMLNAAGHPAVVFRFRLATAIVNIAGFLIAVSFGIVAVAAAFVLRGYLLLPLNLVWMRRYAGVPVRAYLAQLMPAAVVALVMGSAMLGVKGVMIGRLPDVALLAAELAAGAAAGIAALFFLQREAFREVVSIVREVAPTRRRMRHVGRDGPVPQNAGPFSEEERRDSSNRYHGN